MRPASLAQPASIDEMFLYRLHRLQVAAGGLVTRLCEQTHGITRREWRLLAQLAGHEDALSSELAALAALDRVRTSRTVTRLVEKGLMERRPRPGDRREVRLRLTAAGRAAYDDLLPRIAAINRGLVEVLSAPQVAALDAALTALQRRAQDMLGGDAVDDEA
ncbi:MarR family transcriptional regulator [Ottowia sp.]|uniref:MarR family winged helix-turn-helix transcriptional regulator n=1 Tax=Ottowia sp. TaxID=1898956 RepID=UPI0026176192|nr:MarR family transcriptional regulator [Ottowia sp.]